MPGFLPNICCRGCAIGVMVSVFLTMPAQADVTVFAAVSMRNALEDISQSFQETTGVEVTVSLAGSSILARQIEHGAPADLFISAHVAWMDRLAERGLIDDQSRFDLAGNSLVMIAPAGVWASRDLDATLPLQAMLGNGSLAMALVDAVPAGMYGKAALKSLGLWQAVHMRVAQTDNVRSALALVAIREAPLGIVYASDVFAEPEVSVVGRFDESLHPSIVYPVALIAGRNNPDASLLLAYLRGVQAHRALRKQGFKMVAVDG